MTTNVTPFINDSLERLARERKARIESQGQVLAAEGDITIKREQLRLVSAQEANKFNPLPGTLSEYPKTDLANQKGPNRFESAYYDAKSVISSMPTWAIYIIVAIAGFLIFRMVKRG